MRVPHLPYAFHKYLAALLLVSRLSSNQYYGSDGSSPSPLRPLLHSGTRQAKKNTLKKELGFISITALVVNEVIGAGVIITPALILQRSGSFGLSLLLWLVGGVITTFASLCYLEMALLVKKSGSTYVYIKEAYSFSKTKPWMEGVGSFIAFLMVWTDLIIVKPVSSAIVYRALGRYVCRPFFVDCQVMPIYAVKMFGLFVLCKYVQQNLQ